MSAEKQSTEIGLKTYREDVFLIISLKTVIENLHLVKSYNKTNLNVFVPCLWEKYRWGLTYFGQYIFIVRKVFETLKFDCIWYFSYSVIRQEFILT